MKKIYTISLDGCDASTVFTMELTEEEAAFVKKLSRKSEQVSDYSCMPTLDIREETKSVDLS